MHIQPNILDIHQLCVQFHTQEGIVKALDGVSFSIPKGKTLGLVGESGCGKSVTALSIMRLLPENKAQITNGQITYQGEDILKLSSKQMRTLRGNRISMIFQDPMTCLNPVLTIGDQIAEAICLHQRLSYQEALKQSEHMLSLVGIPSPKERLSTYPHQLSGGMRQRVMIAMALSCKPDLLIADEPTTALDVTIQAQILDLLKKLQAEMGMSILLITHDLGVVAEACDEVVVMYAGQVVETGSVMSLFEAPRHPYTHGLLSSVIGSHLNQKNPSKRLQTIQGLVPNLLHLPKGCRFQDRCNRMKATCQEQEPTLFQSKEQQYRCFYPHPAEQEG